MATSKLTRGTCAFCGQSVAKRSIVRHLSSCPEYQSGLQRAEKSSRKAESILHLRVQAAHDVRYWLDLEMESSATLRSLDEYLRAIWLECCGHMSEFSIGGWGGEEIPMSRRAGSALRAGVVVTHIYDFGTESVALTKAVGERVGRPLTSHPISLLARNVMPPEVCIECGESATYLCMECVIEYESPGSLCDSHADTHPHGNYGDPILLVNSPRVGLCGYTGPAEAPY